MNYVLKAIKYLVGLLSSNTLPAVLLGQPSKTIQGGEQRSVSIPPIPILGSEAGYDLGNFPSLISLLAEGCNLEIPSLARRQMILSHILLLLSPILLLFLLHRIISPARRHPTNRPNQGTALSKMFNIITPVKRIKRQTKETEAIKIGTKEMGPKSAQIL